MMKLLISVKALEGKDLRPRKLFDFRRNRDELQLPAEQLGNIIAGRIQKSLYGSLEPIQDKMGEYKLITSLDPFGYTPCFVGSFTAVITDDVTGLPVEI